MGIGGGGGEGMELSDRGQMVTRKEKVYLLLQLCMM